MVQLAKDLHQALELFFQIDALMQRYGIRNDFKDHPVELPMDTVETGGEIRMTILGGQKSAAHVLHWHCGLYLDEDFDDVTEDPIETYRAFVEVVLMRGIELHYALLFRIRCIVSVEKMAWTLMNPTSDEVVAIIDVHGSPELKDRYLKLPPGQADERLAMDLIEAVLRMTGASKQDSDRPAPVTLPSPGSAVPKPRL